jgi:Na+/H+ antiporter NhaD/arsenite permease-like protein
MRCLASARRQGVHVGAWEFTRTGVLVTLPMLAGAGLTLWLLMR